MLLGFVGVAVAALLVALPVRAGGQQVRTGQVDLGHGTLIRVRAFRPAPAKDGPRPATIEISDPSGRLVQRFTDVSEYFETDEGKLCFRDYDFDGYRDLATLRERAGKYVKYAVRHYDPSTSRFVRDALARRLSRLANLRVDAERRRLRTYYMGPPVNYLRHYSVAGGQLRLEESCEFDTRNYVLVKQRHGEAPNRTSLANAWDLPCREDEPQDPAICF